MTEQANPPKNISKLPTWSKDVFVDGSYRNEVVCQYHPALARESYLLEQLDAKDRDYDALHTEYMSTTTIGERSGESCSACGRAKTWHPDCPTCRRIMLLLEQLAVKDEALKEAVKVLDDVVRGGAENLESGEWEISKLVCDDCESVIAVCRRALEEDTT